MKHWDLIPGELVSLRRGLDSRRSDGADPETLRGEPIRARFVFHTTRLACFETITLNPHSEPSLLQFEALDDGSLRELQPRMNVRRCWHVVDADRHTRMVARQPLGERPHFSAADRDVTRIMSRAAKGASA